MATHSELVLHDATDARNAVNKSSFCNAFSGHVTSRHLKQLVGAGVLQEMAFGREKLFIHPKLMNLLTRESNDFESYPLVTPP